MQAAASTLALPHAWALAQALAPEGQAAVRHEIYFDERFARARELAGSLAVHGPLVPVQGDMTGVWNAGLRQACGRVPLALQGITTDSFYFCLSIMVGERARLETRVSRLDRDLYRWSIRSEPRGQGGTVA